MTTCQGAPSFLSIVDFKTLLASCSPRHSVINLSSNDNQQLNLAIELLWTDLPVLCCKALVNCHANRVLDVGDELGVHVSALKHHATNSAPQVRMRWACGARAGPSAELEP